jgi:hypothetical protein
MSLIEFSPPFFISVFIAQKKKVYEAVNRRKEEKMSRKFSNPEKKEEKRIRV